MLAVYYRCGGCLEPARESESRELQVARSQRKFGDPATPVEKDIVVCF